jgi:hypothetical protein
MVLHLDELELYVGRLNSDAIKTAVGSVLLSGHRRGVLNTGARLVITSSEVDPIKQLEQTAENVLSVKPFSLEEIERALYTHWGLPASLSAAIWGWTAGIPIFLGQFMSFLQRYEHRVTKVMIDQIGNTRGIWVRPGFRFYARVKDTVSQNPSIIQSYIKACSKALNTDDPWLPVLLDTYLLREDEQGAIVPANKIVIEHYGPTEFTNAHPFIQPETEGEKL